VSFDLTVHSLDSLDFIDYEFGTRHSTSSADVVTVHQVHSARVIWNCGTPARHQAVRPDADALIENTPGIAVGVKTADCVPILLADPKHHAVAAIHAGWRGSAAGIVYAAVQSMGEEFGTRPDDIYAAIGPSIGPCCYEVGEEVAAKFGIPGSGHVHLDLRAINAGQLTDAGVPARNVSTSPACTKCESDFYHSFRRDREAAGRMISWIRIKPRIKPE